MFGPQSIATPRGSTALHRTKFELMLDVSMPAPLSVVARVSRSGRPKAGGGTFGTQCAFGIWR